MPCDEYYAAIYGGHAMTKRPLKNLAASVHQRLLNKAQESGLQFNGMLRLYAIERFIYRLSKTEDGKKCILKGAIMFMTWRTPVTRPTKDIDLLGRMSNEVENVASVMRKACIQEVEDDGMLFDPKSVHGSTIVADADSVGVRINLQGNLGNARIVLQIDVGFGDVAYPSPRIVEYPVILDFPAPRMKGYARESAIAEKFHAMVKRDFLNSRMKDFYDIWLLSEYFTFDGKTLSTAIKKVFNNRSTPITKKPVCFSMEFMQDKTKIIQWNAFVRKSKLDNAPASFEEVAMKVVSFLEPVVQSLNLGKPFSKKWKTGGKWTK
jgi:predicted nucleotidyltransferase component of viral defense system